MAFSFAITVNGAERTITIDPDELPMSFFEDLEEAQATSRPTLIIRAVAAACGLTNEERRALTVRQFKQLSEAIKEATNVPLGSG